MNSPIDYFYNHAVRWSFGFENPNKAAVVFAYLFPLLFSIWNLAWHIKRPVWLKTSLITILFFMLLGDGVCLCKTYSRGGVVAASIAVLYFLLAVGGACRTHKWSRFVFSAKFNATCLLAGLLVALFVGVGLGQRSLDPVMTGDASVGHRLVLWRSALQMAVENPLGFGTGKSGEAYMQWYQPIDAAAGYRTMVSSYLTFLVEQGWIWSLLALLALVLFWFWARPGTYGSIGFMIAIGLRASILAFLASGIFSTVMEEPILWIIPVSCALILFVWSWIKHVPLPRPKMAWAFVLPLLVLSGLYLGGAAESRADPLSRKFVLVAGGRTVSELAFKNVSARQKTWVVVPDAKILGPCYGKLLRQLVTETGVVLELRKPTDLHGDMDRALITGSAVEASAVSSTTATVLLMPASIPVSSARAWLASSPHLILLVPSIDEDRRSSFWRHCVPDPAPPHLTVTALDGVGLRVDWDWRQVINLIGKS